jgi:hypothetical protein
VLQCKNRNKNENTAGKMRPNGNKWPLILSTPVQRNFLESPNDPFHVATRDGLVQIRQLLLRVDALQAMPIDEQVRHYS